MSFTAVSNNSKNILNVLTFDITKYFESDYQIIKTEDSPAVQIVDYERLLSKSEFDLFDTLHLMVMFDKFFITSDTHMNATFRLKNRKVSIEEMRKITNLFYEMYGSDDAKRKKWSKVDSTKLKDYTFNRLWPTGLGDSFVKLAYKEETGFEVSILFLNNLLEFVGKKIQFV